MRTILIDDDQTALNLLTKKLADYPNIEVVGTATDGKSGLQLLEKTQPDIIFLDVELPDINGIDFLERMDEANYWCHVVIFTSYSQYMLPAFRKNAFDYLMKPIDDNDLSQIISRIEEDRNNPRRISSGNTITRQRDGKMLLYLNTEDFRLVDMNDIGVFQYNHGLRSWEVIVANQKQPVKLKRSVTNQALLALDDNFVQVNQKYIINISCLMKVKDNICHFFPPFDEIDYVKVGRFFRRKLIERFKTF